MQFVSRNLYNKLQKLLFSVGYLSAGTICAQLINFFTLFYLARYSSLETINLLAIITANITGLAPFLSLRFEVALVISRDNKEKLKLAASSLLFSLLICIIMFLYILLDQKTVIDGLNQNTSGIYILILALIINNINTFGAAWLNSEARYKTMAVAVILQAVSYFLLTILFVTFFKDIGAALALTTSYFILGVFYLFSVKSVLTFAISFLAIKDTFRSFWRYPVISMPMAVVNGYHQVLPILFISKYFSAAEVALFFIVQRYIGSPIAVISTAVSNIALRDFSQKIGEGIKSTFAFYSTILFLLSLLAILVLVLIPIEILQFVTNNPDLSDGILIAMATPIIVKAVVAPISGILPSVNKIEYEAYWKLPAFCLLFFALSYLLNQENFSEFLFQLAFVEVLLYLAYFAICFIAVSRK